MMATKNKVFFSLLSIFSVLCGFSLSDDDFTEELLLRPLESGHLYSYFQFTTKWNVDPTSQSSCKWSQSTPVNGAVRLYYIYLVSVIELVNHMLPNSLCKLLLHPIAVQHYHLFPMSLGEVLNKFSVQELHLTLTQGLWRHDKWGYPIIDSPPGAQLWVWFQEGTTKCVHYLNFNLTQS